MSSRVRLGVDMTPELKAIHEQLVLLRKEVRYVRDWMLQQQGKLDDRRRSFDRSIKLITLLLLSIAVMAAL